MFVRPEISGSEMIGTGGKGRARSDVVLDGRADAGAPRTACTA